MSWMQKKRAMMMQAAAPTPSETPITGLSWTIKKIINSSGSINNANYGSYSSEFAVTKGQVIKRTGLQSYNGANINMFILCYTGTGTNTFVQRVPSSSMAVGATATIPNDDTIKYARISFAYGSTSGMEMTQTAIDAAYGASFVN